MASRVSISFLALSIVCLFALGVAAAAEEAEEAEVKEFVLTLDHSNFSDTIAKHDFIVVEFYAPWCGHCKHLAPEYEKAASILSSHDPPIALAKVDANEDVNKELASKYDVQGFPTIKILRNGGKDIQDYNGPREADGIVDYLKKQSGPASVKIKSSDDGATIIVGKKIVVVGVFPKLSGEEYDKFIALSEKLRATTATYEFAHTVDAKFLPRGDTSVAGPLVRLFKPFDEQFVDSKDFDSVALEKFIDDSSLPVVTLFDNDPSNHPFVSKFFNAPNAKAMMFMDLKGDGADAFTSKYRQVAEENRGNKDISFLLGDVEASQGAFQYFGLKEDQVPLIIIQTNDGQKYLKTNLESDQIAPWIKEYQAGNAKPFKKSEPIPEKNDEPVKVVVADSLQDIVYKSGKNVLLEFYAPWCGHCKQLAPILDEVAVHYESDSDVVIAKFDATANDIIGNDFDVKGYPTIYFRSSTGKITSYEGISRTKEEIIDFIDKNRDGKTEKQDEKIEEKQDDKQDSVKDEL